MLHQMLGYDAEFKERAVLRLAGWPGVFGDGAELHYGDRCNNPLASEGIAEDTNAAVPQTLIVAL